MWQTKFKRCIYTSPSGFKVYQNLLFRWLTLNSEALQTMVWRKNLGRPVLYYMSAFTLMARHHWGSVCLLGLGGGGVAHYLNKQSGYSDITILDNSQQVIDIANRFFSVEQLPQMTLIHQNANDYVLSCNKNYSHILIDLYNSHHFPHECTNEEFFQNCKRCLTPDGYLAINLANYKEQESILVLIKTLFKNIIAMPISNCGNMVLLASNSNDKAGFITQLEKTQEVYNIHWMDFWGYVAEVR